MYAAFVPRKKPATLTLIRDKAVRTGGITNIKKYKIRFLRLNASSKFSFLNKSSFKGLLRKRVKTVREIKPTVAPPNKSPRKCLPRYNLENATSNIITGAILLMFLLLKIAELPAQSAVVIATCPEGKPKGEGVNVS